MFDYLTFKTQMLTLQMSYFNYFRLTFRLMLFVPPVLVFAWYFLGNVGAYAAGSTGLIAFGILGYFGAFLMLIALIVMITARSLPQLEDNR